MPVNATGELENDWTGVFFKILLTIHISSGGLYVMGTHSLTVSISCAGWTITDYAAKSGIFDIVIRLYSHIDAIVILCFFIYSSAFFWLELFAKSRIFDIVIRLYSHIDAIVIYASGNKNQKTGKTQQNQRNLEGGHQWPFLILNVYLFLNG